MFDSCFFLLESCITKHALYSKSKIKLLFWLRQKRYDLAFETKICSSALSAFFLAFLAFLALLSQAASERQKNLQDWRKKTLFLVLQSPLYFTQCNNTFQLLLNRLIPLKRSFHASLSILYKLAIADKIEPVDHNCCYCLPACVLFFQQKHLSCANNFCLRFLSILSSPERKNCIITCAARNRRKISNKRANNLDLWDWGFKTSNFPDNSYFHNEMLNHWIWGVSNVAFAWFSLHLTSSGFFFRSLKESLSASFLILTKSTQP